MPTFSTPSVPAWIRELRVRKYRNVFEYDLGQRNLFGTETLFGDWSGDLLLLAKDFAPSRLIEERLAADEPTPYRHEPSLPTNRNLVRLLEGYPRGVMYASACFFLRDDGKWSGALPNRKEVLAVSRRVYDFTVARMPNLRAVACLGKDAWDFVNARRKDWRECMEAREPLQVDGLTYFSLAHPGGLGTRNRGKEETQLDWAAMLERLRSMRNRAA